MSKEDRLKRRYKRKGKRYLKAEYGSEKEKRKEKKLDEAHAKLKEHQAEKASAAQKKEFPEIKEKNQGKFTRWVEKNMSGKTTCKAASVIVNKNKKEEKKGIKPNKRTYKPAVFKMANYANNFGCSKKK